MDRGYCYEDRFVFISPFSQSPFLPSSSDTYTPDWPGEPYPYPYPYPWNTKSNRLGSELINLAILYDVDRELLDRTKRHHLQIRLNSKASHSIYKKTSHPYPTPSENYYTNTNVAFQVNLHKPDRKCRRNTKKGLHLQHMARMVPVKTPHLSLLKQHICILLPRLNLNINSSHINNHINSHTRKVNTRNKVNNTLNKDTHHKEATMRQVRRWDISNNLRMDTNSNLMDINRDMVNSKEVLLAMAFWGLA
ncbi:hypothetical protein BofuT4_P070130.1 [Botrytis cinerea T4]|uniref:Uncharacterized protein n=1 Tax=Botryotinia fuckeliana (strain T4) TaxID=999810 RepID=G2XQ49_BOTF4|nr:hypothetical protein BofuT4_P070130.1 [Botrytis cinerea T4]